MDSTRFTAALLRGSANAFASMAVGRAVEAGNEESEPDDSFGAWQGQFRVLLQKLAVAVEEGRQEQFAAEVGWVRDAFAARGMEVGAFRTGLIELRGVLVESLPSRAWKPLPEYFEAAFAELDRSPAERETGLASLGETAENYLALIRAGDALRAIESVTYAIRENRVSIPEVLERILPGVLREIGSLWHTGELNVAEEHFGSHTTGRLLEHVLLLAPRQPPLDRTVVITMVAGDAHDLGLRIAAAFFELDGWRTICLGANTPARDLSLAAVSFDADLVVIGATLHTHREGAVRAIEEVRGLRPEQKILVGGPGFIGFEARADEIGANGCALTAREASQLGRDLFA